MELGVACDLLALVQALRLQLAEQGLELRGAQAAQVGDDLVSARASVGVGSGLLEPVVVVVAARLLRVERARGAEEQRERGEQGQQVPRLGAQAAAAAQGRRLQRAGHGGCSSRAGLSVPLNPLTSVTQAA